MTLGTKERNRSLKNVSNAFYKRLMPAQEDLDENQRKGLIFIYFLAAIFVVASIIALINFYLFLTLEGADSRKNFYFFLNDLGSLSLLSITWLLHSRYPKLARHFFLGFVIVSTIYAFEISTLNQLISVLSLPVIMASFLIRPIYSFAYFAFIIFVYSSRLYLARFTILDDEVAYVHLASLGAFAIVSWLIAHSLESALSETRTLNRELDQRVKDRTQELSEALNREQTLAIRNATILQSIADGILVFDANQQILMANPTANQMARRNLQAAYQGDLFTSVEAEVQNSLQAWLNGQPPEDRNHIRFEWHERTLSANVAPVLLPQESGNTVSVGNVMVLRDYTREAELERAKDLFLGMVSHELRTPMTSAQGYLELLMVFERENISAESYGYLETINSSIKQLLTLANELIDLSRLETGEIDLYCQWVDMGALIYEAAQLVRQEFNKRSLYLHIQVARGLPELLIDGRRIMQVILNLLSNAYKYTTEGGATVTVSQADEWLEIRVADTGLGIKPKDQDHMFERFFRSADQAIQKAGGTGLGLSISKGLAELHGGSLSFETEYGIGTTFIVRLPKNTLPLEAETMTLEPAVKH